VSALAAVGIGVGIAWAASTVFLAFALCRVSAHADRVALEHEQCADLPLVARIALEQMDALPLRSLSTAPLQLVPPRVPAPRSLRRL